MIMSTLMLASASGTKIAAATPGLSATLAQGDLRLVAREGDAGDDLLLHDVLLVADERAKLRVRRIVEGRAHVEPDLIHHRQFDRAHLQHLGAERSHFQHFLERHFGEPARLRHDARVGRVDAVDVGIDIAAVGRDRRGERNRATCPSRRARASSPGWSALCTPWKPATTAISPAANPSPSRVSVDARDAGRAMRVVGDESEFATLPTSAP